jgi:acyl carrier protein
MRSKFASETRTFIVNNYLMGKEDSLTNDSSFLELGIIDSTGMLELISHLENTYGIEIADDELIPDNLDSISRIADYLCIKVPNQRTEAARMTVTDVSLSR